MKLKEEIIQKERSRSCVEECKKDEIKREADGYGK